MNYSMQGLILASPNISGGPLWVVILAVNCGVRFPKLRCSAEARWAQVSTQMQVIR